MGVNGGTVPRLIPVTSTGMTEECARGTEESGWWDGGGSFHVRDKICCGRGRAGFDEIDVTEVRRASFGQAVVDMPIAREP
jgi:hypothetical protein